MIESLVERRDNLGADEARLVWPARLIIGVVQGLLLWWLWRSLSGDGSAQSDPTWPASIPTLFAPLALVCSYVPVLLLGGVGRMRVRTLISWSLTASAALALMAWYGAARQTAEQLEYAQPYVGFPLAAFSAAALFIVHHLILPADQARRWLADYPAYFDTAWKAGVQLALSFAFVGVFWLVLGLGAALFDVIGLSFLSDLIGKDWFAIPVTCLVFAAAVHLTDVRDGLIRGVRTVALMLLSWLLPLMAFLAAGFLVALPFTGLDGLFETGSSAALVLSAAAGLIILINTAYQDGREDNRPPPILRGAARLASLLLIPLVGIAYWALSLRIGQYGLTPDRIIALACALVGTAYALGYAFAATLGYGRFGRWMQPLERTNVWAGLLAVILIVALFSALVDPARMSVNDQVGRLERGAVTPETFDYRFLRFESGAAGMEALRRLARSDHAVIAANAQEALETDDRWASGEIGRPDVTPRYNVVGDAALPAGFAGPISANDDRRVCIGSQSPCTARAVDLDQDGDLEVLLYTYRLQLWDETPEGWRLLATYESDSCESGIVEGIVLDAAPIEPELPTLDLGEGGTGYPAPVRVCT